MFIILESAGDVLSLLMMVRDGSDDVVDGGNTCDAGGYGELNVLPFFDGKFIIIT